MTFLFSLVPVTCVGRSTAAPGSAKSAEVISVGVTEYQNIEATYKKYEQFFKELALYADKNQSITFRFAIGTYGEVLEWYNKRQIDIGILSAMPTAELLLAGQKGSLDRAYLGDISVSFSPEASERTIVKLFPERPRDPFTYRAGCIVLNDDRDIRTIDDIKRYWEVGRLKFLFVRPYSMSGYIVPLGVLKNHGIDVLKTTENVAFTYQHKKSLEELIKQIPGVGNKDAMHYVAFVLDETNYKTTEIPAYDSSRETFRRISIPDLDEYAIPREIVLANYLQERDKLPEGPYPNKFEKYKAIMSSLLTNWAGRTTPKIKAQFQHALSGVSAVPVVDWRSRRQEWATDYLPIEKALDPKALPRQLLYKSNIDDLLDDMAKSRVPPRLALVLSGGGAKCAYQAGAVVEIEKKLRARGLDIGLVVGTSGGAINALLVALGVTASDHAEDALGKTWESFNQKQFLQPSRRFTLIFGVCFGLLQCLLIAVSVLLFDGETMNWKVTSVVLGLIGLFEFGAAIYFDAPLLWVGAIIVAQLLIVAFIIGLVTLVDIALNFTKILSGLQHWRRLTVVLMLFFSAVEFLIARFPSIGGSIENLSENHWVSHFWTGVTLLSVWSFPYPLVLAIIMVLVGGLVVQKFDWTRFREPFVWWLAIILVFGSSLLVLEALFKESAPSRSVGIEQAFVENIPGLIADTVKPGFKVQTSTTSATLEEVSKQVMGDNLLKRDLIITASNLPFYDGDDLKVNNLPDDLYFYFQSPASPQKAVADIPADKRFIPLKFNEKKLLDVVIGSSTIYPIFPSRALNGVKQGSEDAPSHDTIDLRIIDGGFIHNIPIEAAYLWGATHIILIDASPTPQLLAPRNFWDNSLTAFGYLFRQAQRTDTLMRSGTFELRPKSKCEKDNIKPVCTYADGNAEPDMDTFDFSRSAARNAFNMGKRDVNDPKPLLERVPGAPVWQTVTASQNTKQLK
jgi:predicted acylesterase/phospholipase RssA/ABC-type phosphate/phosphonate transport system substrate-binding protein